MYGNFLSKMGAENCRFWALTSFVGVVSLLGLNWRLRLGGASLLVGVDSLLALPALALCLLSLWVHGSCVVLGTV